MKNDTMRLKLVAAFQQYTKETNRLFIPRDPKRDKRKK